ncbi:general stress protein 13 [Mammaliicoccus lentus]|uniref:S1 domain-containing post-transcriptional regulator Ygs n=1 Tax=Mammaliicoccus lentus TaxID=42858 RepID=UPI00085BB539|nr:S1 domain-containing post-transcriptional regulator Ygs [Mammaliicoccus lentus]SCU39235.1 general stress protein 13 [Mammaliicoccus lentus]
MRKHYKVGQFVKVKVTGIQPYGAFVETPGHVEGLIHISEVMNDYVHNLNQFLSVGQIVKAKVIKVENDGKLSLSLKENEYFKRQERKKEKRSVLDEIRETEKYGFLPLKERLPKWINQSNKHLEDD